MRKLIYNLKLKTKIFITCSLIIAVTSLTNVQLLYNYVSSDNTESFSENTSETLIQASNYLDEKLRGLFRSINSMKMNSGFNDSLKSFLFDEDIYSKTLATSQLSVMFSELRVSEPFISSIYMYTPKGNFFDLYKSFRSDFNFKKTELYNEYKSEEDKYLFWGKSRNDEIYSDQKKVVPIIIRFPVEGYNGDVLLIINLDEKQMLSYMSGIQANKGNWTLILDKEGNRVVAGSEKVVEMFLKDSNTISEIVRSEKSGLKARFDEEEYLINSQSTLIAPWKIVNIKDVSALKYKLYSTKKYMYMVTAGSILICFIMVLLISSSITKPLGVLKSKMKMITKRNFDVKFESRYNDEVGELGAAFNFMTGEIKELIAKLNNSISELKEEKDKLKSEQLLKRKAELKALQSQINPHFLYNTLDSINWMANDIGASQISNITTSLSNLFRTALSKGHEIVTINDEISNITSYLTIQKIRYAKKLDFNIEIDKQILNLYTTKLILQPLIENAIYHGIKDKDGSGFIAVNGQLKENSVEFTVIDDGLGINPMKLKLINKRLKDRFLGDTESYGIYNVNERIKLNFGDEYGLYFDSEYENGTKVVVRIPKIEMGDVDNYV
jgi:two-component system, sensor histidine kinase YesM